MPETKVCREALRNNLESARNQNIDGEINSLSQDDFNSDFEAENDWSLGPFTRNDELTFRKVGQLSDPTEIGWTSSSIFNPSIIEESGKLYLFYRAAVKKESLGSRIGMSIFSENQGWLNPIESPVIYPTGPNELLSVEDPKVYRFDKSKYVLFYNSAWRASAAEMEKYAKPFGDLACDINYAFSDDLIHWEKRGLVVPYDISRLWAKGAVIPRDCDGNAVRIAGEYWMFLSEGCGDKQFIGKSEDMLHWRFEEQTYPELPKSLGTRIFEVATAVVDEDRLILDFMYLANDGRHRGAQALFDLNEPTLPIAIAKGATLAWGGMIKFRGRWTFAQGWDAPDGKEEIYFYSK